MGLLDRGAGRLWRGPGYSAEGAIERNVAQFRTSRRASPRASQLGYHFCFGTLGGWPRFAPADLSATVELANATVEASGRRVDWIHIPVLPDVKEAFFAPLKNLKPRGARVYLGVIHHMDGFKERIAHARANTCRSSGSPPIAASAASRRPTCRRC